MENAGWPWLVYATLSATLGPILVPPLLLLRRARGLEHALHWRERLGHASLVRPPGPLLWFHAVSVGEGMAAIPVIKHCCEVRPALNILMTTGTVTAYSVLQDHLPKGVLCQFAPFDIPSAVKRFLAHWLPQVAIFMESELWPNLVLTTSEQGVALALLNARMSSKSFERWSASPAQSLVAKLLSKFSLILPVSTEEAVHFQVLGAPPAVIDFAGNLKYACSSVGMKHKEHLELVSQIKGRQTWLAASTHQGEEEVIIRIHFRLKMKCQNILTIIAPRHPERGSSIVSKLRKQGITVGQRSAGHQISASTEIYVADTIGELSAFYSAVPIAFVGGSLFKDLCGHNLAEAASAGCAVLTGQYLGHFAAMLHEMRRLSPDAVEQVRGEDGLQVAVEKLLQNQLLLVSRREAARYASTIAAAGVVSRVWKVLDTRVLSPSFDR